MSHPNRDASTHEVLLRTALLLDRLERTTEQLRQYTAQLRAEDEAANGAADDPKGQRR